MTWKWIFLQKNIFTQLNLNNTHYFRPFASNFHLCWIFVSHNPNYQSQQHYHLYQLQYHKGILEINISIWTKYLEKLHVFIKLHNSTIPRVSYKQMAFGIECNSHWTIELTIFRSIWPNRLFSLSITVKYLNSIINHLHRYCLVCQ